MSSSLPPPPHVASAMDGMLVVALEQAVAAPLCTQRFADAGARVIKIERREGDTARHYDSAVAGTSAYFAWLNRGKESIVLDLKQSTDHELLMAMVARADVFIQNLAPGAAARLHLDAAFLTRCFPRLVALNIVGYAQDSAYSAMKAYDLLVQAEAGLCFVTGTPDQCVKVGVSVADIATGLTASALVMEALLKRERTGSGAVIEVAMFDCIADWMTVPLLHHEWGNRSTQRLGMAHASICPYGPVSCSDGQVLVAVQSPSEWQRFCVDVARRPELINQPEFKTNEKRVLYREALDGILQSIFVQLRRDELIARLTRAGLPWGQISTTEDLRKHTALRSAAGRLPQGPIFSVPRPAGRHLPIARGVPALNEHGDRLRAEFGQPVDK